MFVSCGILLFALRRFCDRIFNIYGDIFICGKVYVIICDMILIYFFFSVTGWLIRCCVTRRTRKHSMYVIRYVFFIKNRAISQKSLKINERNRIYIYVHYHVRRSTTVSCFGMFRQFVKRLVNPLTHLTLYYYASCHMMFILLREELSLSSVHCTQLWSVIECNDSNF